MSRAGWKARAALAASVAALIPAGEAAAAPGECPAILPTSSVTPGMPGVEGWTVSSGTDPEHFDVNVLGVLEDGIAPGRDMIVVRASSPAVDKAGIWAGMSGSPVYDGAGNLIGALAYGLTFGPSTIAGLTPAEDLLGVDGYPAAMPKTVRLPRALARRIGRIVGRSAADTSTMTRLKTPLSVSGLNERSLKRVRAFVKRLGMSVVPVAGASAPASVQAAATDVVPGGNFVAAASYGDITIAGVGTTSYVCDGHAIAFGHPFGFVGSTSLGANVADAVDIVDDPVFGSYKLANIGGAVGTVDQDRLAGLRAVIGSTPGFSRIIANLTNLDTGASRHGETDAVLPELIPDLTFLHLLGDTDVVADRIGKGTVRLGWTVEGRRADGSPWTLRRGNMYTSEWDASLAAPGELAGELAMIQNNGFEDVSVDTITVGGNVEQAVRQLDIVDILVKRGGHYRSVRSTIRVRPGQMLRLRIVMRKYGSTVRRRVHFALRVPASVRRGGLLEVTGGGGFGCDVDDCAAEGAGGSASSFPDLLRSFRAQPRNNVLVARIRSGRGFGVTASKRRWLPDVVRGYGLVGLRLR